MRDSVGEKTGKDASLEELAMISLYAGMREDLVQAGGGNSSLKLDERRMAIKASGVQLADVTAERGYCIVDYAMVRRFMDQLARAVVSSSDKELLAKAALVGARPSIETFLHAVTGRVTLHTHPVSVNVLAAREGGMERLGELFPEALLVAYATPGLELAKLYYRAFLDAAAADKKTPSVIFLQNHGLVVCGETAAEVIRLTEAVNEAVEKAVGLDNGPYRRAYEIYRGFQQAGCADGKIVVRAENRCVLQAFATCGFQLWETGFCPDCVVFCGRGPFDFSAPHWQARLQAYQESYGPPVLVTSGRDLFIRAASVKKAREIESVLAFSARVALANQGCRLALLPVAEQAFLLGWEAERYRQKLD